MSECDRGLHCQLQVLQNGLKTSPEHIGKMVHQKTCLVCRSTRTLVAAFPEYACPESKRIEIKRRNALIPGQVKASESVHL